MKLYLSIMAVVAIVVPIPAVSAAEFGLIPERDIAVTGMAYDSCQNLGYTVPRWWVGQTGANCPADYANDRDTIGYIRVAKPMMTGAASGLSRLDRAMGIETSFATKFTHALM